MLKVRVTSYALIFAKGPKSDQILLTLLNRGPNSGKWTLPGGGLHAGESPEQGLLREVYEETGLKLEQFDFLARFDSEFRYPDQEPLRVIKNIYSKQLPEALPVQVVLEGDSTTDVKWFDINQLGKDLIHPTVTQSYAYFQKCFRRATASDAGFLARFVNSAYRGDTSKKGWTTEADILDGQRVDEEKIRELLDAPGSHIELVADSNEPDKILGCVHIRKENPDVLYFGMLVVNPDLQNSGIGKILLTRIENLALEMGCSKVRMSVIHLRKELIEFYERRGYRKTGEAKKFPSDDPRFGIPKVDGLTLLEFEKQLNY